VASVLGVVELAVAPCELPLYVTGLVSAHVTVTVEPALQIVNRAELLLPVWFVSPANVADARYEPALVGAPPMLTHVVPFHCSYEIGRASCRPAVQDL